MGTTYRKQKVLARSRGVLLGAWAALSTTACVALLPAAAAAQTGKEPAMIASGRQLQPLELKDVVISDRFWTARQRTNNAKTIPHVFEQCKKIGHAPVEGLPPATGPRRPRWGSDTTKWLEGACYSLITRPNDEVAA